MIADGSKLDPKTDRWSRNLPYAAASLFGETGIRKFMEAAEILHLHARLAIKMANLLRRQLRRFARF
jgi:hypothetical protein